MEAKAPNSDLTQDGLLNPGYRKSTLELHYNEALSQEDIWLLQEAGQVVYKLKTAYRNGTTHIVLSPLDFLSRLASLVPRPRVHLIRFHGVFAPHCKYRSLMTPDHSNEINTISRTGQKKAKKSYTMGWAKMLKRVFDIDIQICSKCGGQIKIISAIHNQQVIKRILNSLGESSTVPELSPSRGPPETEHGYLPDWT